MAGRAGVQGEVKLHAIIARDGTIQTLSVISGHPLLTTAAMEAVQQMEIPPVRAERRSRLKWTPTLP